MRVTLLDGRSVDSTELVFHPENYHVYYAGEDVTNNMRQSDKAAIWSDFDRAVDNERSYAEKYVRENGHAPPPAGSTSTFVNFWQQITTDPLSAPLETLNATAAKLTGNTTIKWVLIIAAVGVGLYAVSLALKAKGAVSAG